VIDALKENLRERLSKRMAPFNAADPEAATAAIERLASLGGEAWGTLWLEAAVPFAERGAAREQAGDAAGAREAFFNAYALAHVGRYPTPNHPQKLAAYRFSVENYRRAGRYFGPPVEVHTIPFSGRDNEGTSVTFYVRRPSAQLRRPVILRWGGIDTWKEEQLHVNEAILAAGFASINMDMPGVGESPVRGSIDAERQFIPVLDWIASQPDLDADRVIVVGMSYGGYWATKVAHLFADRLCGAVNWGGGIHHFFSRDWLARSANASSYLMDLGIARARSVGANTYEEYADVVQSFSLLDQGILDRPHPPMLIVNGRHDEQAPIDDLILLAEHGRPKTMRFFPGGHMGYGPQTIPTVMDWLKQTAEPAVPPKFLV
jgi:esterase FrsA